MHSRPIIARVALLLLAVSGAPPALAQGVSYTAIIGGSGRDLVFDIAVDSAGNVFVTGETWSPDFPVAGGVQGTLKGTADAFVAKLSPDGQTLVYATYLGGGGFDSGRSIVVDEAGNAYVTGYTDSADFPLQSALDANRGGSSDAFIVKLNPQGNALLFSTYFGGSSADNGDAIALDGQNNVYVAGRTLGGLTPVNAAQSTFGGVEDAFVLKLNAALTAYQYVTYLGGGVTDFARALGVDGLGRACVAGFTQSADFPSINAPAPGPGGASDGFFALLSSDGSTFLVSSRLGGTGDDSARGVACTSSRLAVVGGTNSIDFPTGAAVPLVPSGGVVAAPIQATLGGERDGFLSVYDMSALPAVTRSLETYVGGRRNDQLVDVTINSNGEVSVFGDTESSGLPEIGVPAAGLTGAGFFRSTDGGITWQLSGLKGIGVNDFARAAAIPQRLLAGTDLGLYVSDDGGTTWNRETTGYAARAVHTVAVSPANSCTWVIGVDYASTDPTPVGAARTTDCGATWDAWGVAALRFKQVRWLGDPLRLVATLDQAQPITEGTPQDTCVVDQDGSLVRCFDEGTSDNVIAIDPTDACRWFEANAVGAVWQWSGNLFGCDHPFAFTSLGNLGAPVTALATTATGGPGTRRVYAGLKTGSVISADVATPPTWTPSPVPLGHPVSALEPKANGEVVVSSGPAVHVVSSTGAAATTTTEATGASAFVKLGWLATPEAAARRAVDGYLRSWAADLTPSFASYSGTTCADEARSGFGDALASYHAAVLSEQCRLEDRAKVYGTGFKQENITVTRVSSGSGPPPCTTAVAPEISVIDVDAGSAAIGYGHLLNFANNGTCAVTPVSNVPWVVVHKYAGAPGSAGWVDLQIKANETGAPRSGTVTIGNATITVNQAAAPAPTGIDVVAAEATFGADGGTGLAKIIGDVRRIDIQSGAFLRLPGGGFDTPDDCTGAGSAAYIVDPNPSASSRTGTILVEGTSGQVKVIAVTQAGATPRCASPPTTRVFSVPASGETLSLGIDAPPGCQHTSSEGSPEIGALAFIPGGTSGGPGLVQGTGPGTLTFVVSANPGSGRVFTIDSAGFGISVIQAAADAAVTDRAFLAEGATGTFFDQDVSVANPSSTWSVIATATFDTAQGASFSQSALVHPLGRATFTPKNIPGLATAEFSTSLVADGALAAARLMSWDATGYGSHAETGIAGPATTWYLAEGATHSGFQLFYLLHNPGATDATIEVRYLRPAPLAPIVKAYTVPARTRVNIWVNLEDAALAATDVSAVITSTNGIPIVVERAMYLDSQGRPFNAGHESAGVTTPSTEWFLAEGATGPYFDEFILVANPGNTPAEVTTDFLLGTGTTLTRTYTVAPESRFNIWVDLEDPLLADAAVSAQLTSTNGVPIIVERAMWWPDGGWHEAHNSPGATQTGTRWAVAAGRQGGPAAHSTYVLIANTSPFEGEARVTLMFEDGAPQVARTVHLPPTSRTNVPIGHDFPEAEGRRFGVLVESLGSTPAQIVVEQAIYSDSAGVIWAAGANLLATRLP
jgi:hypothetical protein